jgi:hypothetical protein
MERFFLPAPELPSGLGQPYGIAPRSQRPAMTGENFC